MTDAATDVVGDLSGASERGSKAWANKIRKRARQLSRELDSGQMELARLLYEVYDCPIDGDPNRAAIYTSWGHASFKEYVENELGLHYKKAQRLRAIWYTLEVVLKDVEEPIKERLKELGASKMRELARILDKDNVDKWLAIAEAEPYTVLVNKIQAASLKARKQSLEDELGQQVSDEGTPFPHKDVLAIGGGQTGESQEGFEDGSAAATPGATPTTDENADAELFGAGELRMETFMLAPTQQLNVLTALERASQLTRSSKKGHNLDMICLDFLATNDFMAAGRAPESRANYLAKIERALGIRIVAVDAKDPMTVLYGMGTLATLAGTGEEPEA